MDAVGMSPRVGEGRTMQEQLSRATQDAVAEGINKVGVIYLDPLTLTLSRRERGFMGRQRFQLNPQTMHRIMLADTVSQDALECIRVFGVGHFTFAREVQIV